MTVLNKDLPMQLLLSDNNYSRSGDANTVLIILRPYQVNFLFLGFGGSVFG